MTTMFPPRASFSRTPDVASRPSNSSDNRRETAVVPLAGSSPSFSMFGNADRSPLTPLGTNNASLNNAASFGIRQRRQQKETATTLETMGNGGFPRPGEQMKGPPRASLTLTMGSETSVAPIPTGNDATQNETGTPGGAASKPEEFWIVVFGFSTNEQKDEVLTRFKSIGNVVTVKGVSPDASRNWVALSYDSPLTVEKAVCERLLPLSDGCLCGVQRLSDGESTRFFAHQGGFSSVTEQTVGPDGKLSQVHSAAGLFPIKSNNNDSSNVEMQEQDILLARQVPQQKKHKSRCESFMSWVYGW